MIKKKKATKNFPNRERPFRKKKKRSNEEPEHVFAPLFYLFLLLSFTRTKSKKKERKKTKKIMAEEGDQLLFEVLSDSDEEGNGFNQGGKRERKTPPPPESFQARFLDHHWFEDVDNALEKHAYHERKKVVLCKANRALMRKQYKEALDLCEQVRPLVTQKGETREWAETEARAALALNLLDLAFTAAQRRAGLDRGYEWAGRRLFADTAFQLKRFDGAFLHEQGIAAWVPHNVT